MPKLSPTQIYQYAIQAGFSPVDAVKATAIALAESGGQTDVVNSIGAMGLFQIYDGVYPSASRQAQMADPLANAQAAYAKYAAAQKAGQTPWCPWASFDEGTCAGQANRNNSYSSFMGMAQAAATGVDIATGSSTLVVPGGSSGSSGAGSASDTSTSAGVTTVSTAGGGGGGSQLTLGSFGPFKINVPVGLLWSMLFLFGALALVGIGIYLYFSKEINAAVGKVAETAAIAA